MASAGSGSVDGKQLQAALLAAERRISLFESLSPTNFAEEAQRVAETLAGGGLRLPQYSYAPPGARQQQVDEALRICDAATEALHRPELAEELGTTCVHLLRGRIDELRAEAFIVQACGTDQLRILAAQRFPFTEDELREAGALASRWQAGSRGVSDDPPRLFLAAELAKKARDFAEYPLRIVERPLASIAAAGGDVLYVRAGAKVSAAEASRIWVHEVGAHLMPRLRASSEPPPFEIGTPGCAEDEEGRAILLEERAGYLSGKRRGHLAVRFRLARAVRAGPADCLEVAQEMLDGGVPPPLIAAVLARALRGGGLAREIVYLPAYVRVRTALAEQPHWERYMERGRISIAGARELSAASQSSSKSIHTGV